MSTIKGNIVLNGINTVTSILFPMVTFPYAARVLMPEGIGVVNFQLSIINYIILLTSIGIPLYAIKEIAKYQDEKDLRDKTTIEIVILSSLLALIGYVGVWLIAKFVPQIHEQAALFYILSLSILFNVIGVNWFYQGIEDFKFITIRAICIRTICALSLFLFVKNAGDILIYGLITVGSTVGNNIINFLHLNKHLKLSNIKVKELNIQKHLKPALHIFMLNLIISLYVQLNTIMLGFMQGDDAVGYFTAGTKISHIGLTLISSLGTVLLPRCSNLLKNGDLNKFASVINKSARLTISLSLPMVLGLMILAKPVIILFCGSEFIDSIPVLYLNAPVILLIGLTNVIGIQVLYPMDKVNIVIWSVTGGAIANIILNIILIPKYSATGASIATLVAEFIVLLIQVSLGRNYYPFSWKSIILLRYIISTLIMGLMVGLVYNLVSGNILQVTIGIMVGISSYASCLCFFRDDLMKSLLQYINLGQKD